MCSHFEINKFTFLSPPHRFNLMMGRRLQYIGLYIYGKVVIFEMCYMENFVH